MRIALIPLCLVGLGLLGGCSTQSEFLPKWVVAPKLTVDGVERVAVSDAGASMSIVLTATNENEVALPLVHATYRLEVDGRVYSTDTIPNATAPAGRSVTFRLPASLAGAPGETYRVSGTIRYKPPGQLREAITDMGLPLPSATFNGAGDIVGSGTQVAIPVNPEPTPEPTDDQPAEDQATDQPDDMTQE